MRAKKSGVITYKREKGKVEISGEPGDIKYLVWFDLICSKLQIAGEIILLYIASTASVIPAAWKWIKNKWPLLILFVVLESYSRMLLSG